MYVSALLLRGIADHVSSRGFAVEELVRGTGVDPAVLSESGERVALDCVDRFVTRAMALTDDPGLGLTISTNPPAGALAIIYHLVLASRTLREAAVTYKGLSGRLIEGAEWALEERGDLAGIVYRGPRPLGNTSRFAADLVFAFTSKLCQHFFRGRLDRPTSICFRHERPAYSARYADVFGCPIEYGAPQNYMTFPAELLDAGQLLGNELIKESLEISALRMLTTGPTEERTSDRLRVLLRCSVDLKEVCSETLARQVGLSERSLRRKLQQEGASLTEVIDEVRREIACEELLRPRVCIQTTAEKLGFAERTAFHRAFKRWTGETPKEYRSRRLDKVG